MGEPREIRLPLAVLLVLAALIVAGSSLLGTTRLGWSEVFGPQPSDVFWRLRLPRTLLAACAGAGLAVGGVICQALFRNPLATPYTLGIDTGASLGAAVGFLAGVTGSWMGIPRLGGLALAGALISMLLIYLMARTRAGHEMTRLLLAGVCISYVGTAGIVLATYVSDGAITNEILTWMMGSLAVLRPWASVEILIVLVPLLVFAGASHRALDLLSMDEHLAASRGVAVRPTVWAAFGLVGLLTAVIVANCGPIGFVSLIVPHIARALFGLRTLPVVLASVMIGAAFLAVCDGVARAALAYELPVGVITNLIGSAFFFYLLATRDVSYAGGSSK